MMERSAVALLMCFVVSMTTGAQELAQQAQHAPILQLPHSVVTYRGPAKCRPATIELMLRQHKMPDIVGCPYEEKLAISFREFDDGIPKPQKIFSNAPIGQIVGQAPDPAIRLPSDKPIILTLSKGPEPQQLSTGPSPQPPATGSTTELPQPPDVPIVAEVPEVVGLATSAAQKAITGRRLRAVPGSEESSAMPRGTVTRTEPPAHTQVEQGATVTYWTSSGQVRVPSVEGMPLSLATFVLRKAGLVPGKPSYEFSQAKPGFVSRQEPSADAQVNRGTLVSLWLPSDADNHVNPGPPVSPWPPSAWFSPMSVVAALLVALTAVGVGFAYGYQRHRITRNRRLLHMKPSLASDSETRFILAMQMDGPATALRVRLEMGEVLFGEPLPIERQETNHD